MKILLCTPVNGYGIKIATPPLGLLFIAAVLVEHDVKIFDNYLTKDDYDEFQKKLFSFDPDLVGLTCNVEDRFNAFATIKFIRKLKPKAIIVLGGPFASVCYQQILTDLDCVNFVVVGEGEVTIRELINAFNGKNDFADIKGLAFRQNEQVVFTGQREFINDLNTLPTPAYHLIDVKKYPNYLDDSVVYLRDNDKIHKLKYSASLLFGRGCHYNCTFCSSKALWRRSFRILNPSRAVAQIKYFYEQGINGFAIWDDHLLLNREWFNQFYQLLKLERMNIYFKCLSRVDSINQDIAAKLGAIGCVRVTLGIENGSSNVLKIMNKRITPAQAENAVKLLYDQGILSECGPIVNMPGESTQDIQETLAFFKKLEENYKKAAGMPVPVKIYPGTDLEKRAMLLEPFRNFSWTQPYYEKKNRTVDSNPYVPLYENIPSADLLQTLITESINLRYTHVARSLLFHHLISDPRPVLHGLFSSLRTRFWGTFLYLTSEFIRGWGDYIRFLVRKRNAEKMLAQKFK